MIPGTIVEKGRGKSPEGVTEIVTADIGLVTLGAYTGAIR
jgi:hypothetical protein